MTIRLALDGRTAEGKRHAGYVTVGGAIRDSDGALVGRNGMRWVVR